MSAISQISIFRPDGTLAITTTIADSSQRVRNIMAENYVQVDFVSPTYVDIPLGSTISYEGYRFVKTRRQTPTYNGAWQYSEQFDDADGFLRTRRVKYYGQDFQEMSFALTATLEDFASLIVKDVNKEREGAAFRQSWTVGTIDAALASSLKTISFSGDTLFDACTAIAQEFETEWYITKYYVSSQGGYEVVQLNFRKKESGGEVSFEAGSGKILNQMNPQRGEDTEYGTRFFVFGGTRNLTDEYKEVPAGSSVPNLYENRLHLPNNQAYIDARNGQIVTNLAHNEVLEQYVTFDDVYPKNRDTITAVDKTIVVDQDDNQYYQYTIQADDCPFAGKGDIIETLGIKFETGELAGQEFEAKLESEALPWNKRLIIVAQNQGTDGQVLYVPNEQLKPSVGDVFVLTGVKLPTSKVTAAEEELLAKAEDYAKQHSTDTDVYECVSNNVYCYENPDTQSYDIGTKVKLVNTDLFGANGRSSRVQGMVYSLTKPYEITWQVGDNTKYSRFGAVNTTIEEVKYSQRLGIMDDSLLNLIKSTDYQSPSDTNIYTALAAYNHIYKKHDHKGRLIRPAVLVVPTKSPAEAGFSLDDGEVPLYVGSTGNYSETPGGGGVADIYDLTLRKNGTSLGTINLGEQAGNINIPVGWSDLTPDASHRFLTDSLISTWNAKQDAISDLATIRSNASHGNTAYDWGNHADAGYLTSFTETDPTVPGWAKASTKPTYTLDEVTDGSTRKLANYLPLTGGTISGTLEIVNSTDNKIILKSGDADNYNLIKFVANDDSVQGYLGTRGTADLKWNNYVIYHTNNLSLSTLGGVPTTRKVNNKALSADITLTLDDIGNGSTRSLANYLPLAGGTMTGAAPITMTYNKVALDFRPGNTSYTTSVLYSNAGNEALILSAAHLATSIIFKSGYKLVNDTAWYSQFSDSNKPSLQIKAQSVYVNDFIANGVTPAYNFKVGGSSCFDGSMVFDASTTSRSIYYKASDAVSYRAVMFGSNGDLIIGYDGPAHSRTLYLDGFNEYLRFGATWQYSVKLNSTGTVELSGISAVLPVTANEVNLGSSAKAFNNIYGKLDLSYVQSASDLKAIEALTGTGLAKRTADNTWELTDTADKAGELVTSTEEDAMFTHRQVPSEAVGDVCKTTAVKGKSVVWNQLFSKGGSASAWGITLTHNDDGSYTISGTASASRTIYMIPSSNYIAHDLIGGHIHLIKEERISGSFSGNANSAIRISGKGPMFLFATSSLEKSISTHTGERYPYFVFNSGDSFTDYRFTLQAFDLTLMFGAGNEPTTVEEFEALYPLPYYDYNAGELVNNAASGVEMLDAGGTSLGTIPLNITGLTSGGVQIFPDGMKSAGTAYDEWSGTTATKRIKKLVVSASNTVANNDVGNSHERQYIVFSDAVAPATSVVGNIICNKYSAAPADAVYFHSRDKIIAVTGRYFYIYDSELIGKTAAEVKAALIGLEILYETKTPVTYTTDQPLPDTLVPFESGGTMRRLPVDTSEEVIAPMVCDFQYGANMSDVANAYLPLSGGTVTGTLEAAGELIIPDSAPRNPDSTKVYLYCDTTGNYYQS